MGASSSSQSSVSLAGISDADVVLLRRRFHASFGTTAKTASSAQVGSVLGLSPRLAAAVTSVLKQCAMERVENGPGHGGAKRDTSSTQIDECEWIGGIVEAVRDGAGSRRSFAARVLFAAGAMENVSAFGNVVAEAVQGHVMSDALASSSGASGGGSESDHVAVEAAVHTYTHSIAATLWSIASSGGGSVGGESASVPTTAQVERFLRANPHICDAISARLCAGIVPEDQMALSIPRVLGESSSSSSSTYLLSRVARWALAAKLPATHTKSWSRLFSSMNDGKSFSRFCAHAICKGPCILVIRDTDSHVFGAYIPCSLRKHNAFFGDAGCFVFSLFPDTRIYPASGVNTNFAWLSSGMQSCPNGIGIGGQLSFWGIFIGDGLEEGECRAPCSTFEGMPQLTKAPKFKVAEVELWACIPDYEPSDEELIQAGLKSEGNGTVLDDTANTMLFELTGRVGYSKDVRAEKTQEGSNRGGV